MQRYFAQTKNRDNFVLNADDLFHIKTVMRMTDGDLIEVVYQNNVYICRLDNINGDIKVIIVKNLENIVKKDLEIVLAIPLVKEQKMDLILQKSTELGVNKIIPFIAERSIIKLTNDKEQNKINRWQRICKEASEQSKRVDIPIVTNVKSLKDLTNFEGQKLVCSTKKYVNSIKMFLQKQIDCDKLLLVIGPEGGLSEKEETYLVNHDFHQVTLGNRIMRVETVPLFLLSIINYEFME
ncbi:MAG: 16S rRNA (uracil(1498)-N(3))-methyltransferase [Bacilli bacterium]|nr:16S rRNA (uracil(1498)-N(3))-methyltransferase [Bacilli bacterium]